LSQRAKEITALHSETAALRAALISNTEEQHISSLFKDELTSRAMLERDEAESFCCLQNTVMRTQLDKAYVDIDRMRTMEVALRRVALEEIKTYRQPLTESPLVGQRTSTRDNSAAAVPRISVPK